MIKTSCPLQDADHSWVSTLHRVELAGGGEPGFESKDEGLEVIPLDNKRELCSAYSLKIS